MSLPSSAMRDYARELPLGSTTGAKALRLRQWLEAALLLLTAASCLVAATALMM